MMTAQVPAFDGQIPVWFTCVLGIIAAAGWLLAGIGLIRLRRQSDVFQPSDPLPLQVSPLPVDPFPGCVIVLDDLGYVLHANEEAVAQFGEGVSAILRHPAARSALSAALRARSSLSEGDELPPVCSTTFNLDVPVPRTLHLALRALPVRRYLEGRVIAVLSDRSEAQALDRMRIDFVAHASHELRTPLASLSGFIDALRGPASGDPQAREQFLEIMFQQAARMKRLIDRLLYLSRVQAHEHQKPREIVEVSDLMAVVLGEVAPRFGNSDCTLDLSVEDGLLIRADEDEIVQVLLNLIENALRYGRRSPEDPIAIILSAKRAAAMDDRWPKDGGVILGVSDNGKGIESHHLPRLTERFYRVPGAVDPAHAGTGLGLAIVRHILDRHGGRLRLSSAPGKGTNCQVWLPGADPALAQG
ncbi:sensor histidine kinase [Gluconobacter wancherniae]|nr:ATP-binding protein [Gluconobacter wancherniae]MBF0854764.1 two-component sensor histidine kinase [Gluconobacter wancherniae]MBS1063520.1 two-component sensor histidine kinase [Gluconobacter wancherniae]MBS1095091.1 two-component sensor histidine kinase [Gluconobacter wancherniae]